MSTISDALDYFADTLIPAALPSYVEIPDSISIEDNADLYFDQGYAVFLGEDDNTRGSLKSQADINTQIGVTLVNHLPVTRSNTEDLRLLKKNIKNDAELIWKRAHFTDPCFGGLIHDCIYISSTPVEYLDNDDFRFYVLTLNFDVRYIESA